MSKRTRPVMQVSVLIRIFGRSPRFGHDPGPFIAARTGLERKMTSVYPGHRLGGAPRRNRTGDPILTMESPGTAVRTAVPPVRARPSGPKLPVLLRRSYAFTFKPCAGRLAGVVAAPVEAPIHNPAGCGGGAMPGHQGVGEPPHRESFPTCSAHHAGDPRPPAPAPSVAGGTSCSSASTGSPGPSLIKSDRS